MLVVGGLGASSVAVWRKAGMSQAKSPATLDKNVVSVRGLAGVKGLSAGLGEKGRGVTIADGVFGVVMGCCGLEAGGEACIASGTFSWRVLGWNVARGRGWLVLIKKYCRKFGFKS